MADIAAMGETIKWGVNIITILLMVIASWMAIRKNNNLALGVAVVGNLVVYNFTQSPLLCWVVSIGCMIWAGMTKARRHGEADLGVSKSMTTGEVKESGKIKCRYCKKLYDSEYNGCPYCKKV